MLAQIMNQIFKEEVYKYEAIKSFLYNIIYNILYIIVLLIIYNVVAYYQYQYCTGWSSILMIPTPICTYALWILTNMANIIYITYGIYIVSIMHKLFAIFKITNIIPYQINNHPLHT